MRNDEQTHVLPNEPEVMHTLAQSMCCQDNGEQFVAKLHSHITACQ